MQHNKPTRYTPHGGYRPFISDHMKDKLKTMAVLASTMALASPFYATPASPKPIMEGPMQLSQPAQRAEGSRIFVGAASPTDLTSNGSTFLFDGKSAVAGAFIGKGNIQERYERGREIRDIMNALKEWREKRAKEKLMRKEDAVKNPPLERRMCVGDSIDETDFRLTLSSIKLDTVQSFDPFNPIPIVFISSTFALLDKIQNTTSELGITPYSGRKFKVGGKDMQLTFSIESNGKELKCGSVKLKR